MGYKKFGKCIILLVILCILLCACSQSEFPDADQPPQDVLSYALTPQQAQTYQTAVCHLLKREGENLYRVQYRNCGVTFADGILHTNYDAMAVAVSDPFGASCYPVLDLNGTDRTKGYLGSISLQDSQGNFSGWRFLLQEDSTQGKPVLTAMRPRDTGTDEDLLAGQFQALPDLSAYEKAVLLDGTYYETTYGDDGALLPLSAWTATEMISGHDIVLADDFALHYVPLVGGDYYLLYEITDTEGNTYCSELIPYQTDPEPAPVAPEPCVTVKWAQGSREQLLLESNGIELYLSVEKNLSGDSFYALKAKNNTQSAITCRTENGIVNGVVSCSTATSMNVDPGKFVANESRFNFGVADGSPELETIDTLQFSIHVTQAESGATLIEPQTVLLDMTDAWPVGKQYTDYFRIEKPAMDALAEEQLLLETDSIRLTLVNAGKNDKFPFNDLTMVFKLENLSPRSQRIDIDGAVINGMFEPLYCDKTLPAGCVTYEYDTISESFVMDYLGNSIESLSLLVETRGQEPWANPSVHQHWIPVTLKESGTATAVECNSILWETDSQSVGILGYDEDDTDWSLLLSNASDQSIRLVVLDAETGEKVGSATKAGPNQKACFKITAPPDIPSAYAIRFQIYDFNGNTLLSESAEKILLETP